MCNIEEMPATLLMACIASHLAEAHTCFGCCARLVCKDSSHAAAHRHDREDRLDMKNQLLLLQIGTACVTRGQDSRLALGRLGALVEQLETLVRGGREVILVTSG